MAIKRSDIIDDETPGFYHLTSRCVRRAFLCGIDEETGVSYEHRCGWIESRIVMLADLFAIEVYGYAVMHNHYHLVVYFDPRAPWRWSDDEVARRWLQLFPIKANHPRYESLYQAKLASVINDRQKLEQCRERLGSISWLMRCINEPIAKRSNAEDFVKGHFWESRFKSQALLDEAAAIACMAYVDLNPIRAGLTMDIESSEYTSIQRRLMSMTETQLEQAVSAIAGKISLKVLSITFNDYLDLVEWTGKRIVHHDKAVIPPHLANLMQRLNLKERRWLSQVSQIESRYARFIGPIESMKAAAESLKQYWIKGMNAAQALYCSSS